MSGSIADNGVIFLGEWTWGGGVWRGGWGGGGGGGGRQN